MAFPPYSDAAKRIEEALRYKGDYIDTRGYLAGYPALINLFSILDFSKLLHVQAGAYAVYGWMPRVLTYKASDEDCYKALGQFVVEIRSLNVRNALDKFRNTQKFAINNSVVGTSKFLHFAAPNIFPIWDSKIAGYFDSQPTAADDYYAYCESLHLYLPQAKWPDSFPDQLNASEVTPLRKLEFCLFRKAADSRNKN